MFSAGSIGMTALVLGVAAVCCAQDKPPVVTDTIVYQGGTKVEFKLVRLPAGKIIIKDKDGREKVVEIKPICIGQVEVRWDEYNIYYQRLDQTDEERKAGVDAENRPSHPYEPPQREYGNEGLPAGSITFAEARKYCNWLSKKTGHRYRLPTEAEWKYACTAGGTWKVEKSHLGQHAWYTSNSDEKPHAAGMKHPNPWGLHDMLGNVAEWVTREDGTGTVAGGSFKDDPDDIHAEHREDYSEKWQERDPNNPKGQSWLASGPFVGIRVVRED